MIWCVSAAAFATRKLRPGRQREKEENKKNSLNISNQQYRASFTAFPNIPTGLLPLFPYLHVVVVSVHKQTQVGHRTIVLSNNMQGQYTILTSNSLQSDPTSHYVRRCKIFLLTHGHFIIKILCWRRDVSFRWMKFGESIPIEKISNFRYKVFPVQFEYGNTVRRMHQTGLNYILPISGQLIGHFRINITQERTLVLVQISIPQKCYNLRLNSFLNHNFSSIPLHVHLRPVLLLLKCNSHNWWRHNHSTSS